MSDGSVTSCVIQVLALLPNNERGIFVMILLLSIVTVLPAPEGMLVLIKVAGATKFLGCQSFRKKPIVFANGGSIAGAITTVVSTGIGSVPPLPFFTIGVDAY